ncbi:unnamed protein product [Rangifer tarandus platyrhynchus]|uniref:Uncharacterized protein n=2 Tax=Rangifer tarandus platyrhynchus TaxID=3082113 RepID=A0AC59ZA18_RANTA|nr:unnamed protein product [Rangifer tarandus platyrhynchus]
MNHRDVMSSENSKLHKMTHSMLAKISKTKPSIKESTFNAGDVSLIPWLGRFPGRGHSDPLQYYCLENPMDRGAWWATVHGVTKELDRTEATEHTHMIIRLGDKGKKSTKFKRRSLCGEWDWGKEGPQEFAKVISWFSG